MLERCILGRLGEVAVHLAGSREHTLYTSGRGGRGEVLLDHLGQGGPCCFLLLPPLEHVGVDGGLLGVEEVLCNYIARALYYTGHKH